MLGVIIREQRTVVDLMVCSYHERVLSRLIRYSERGGIREFEGDTGDFISVWSTQVSHIGFLPRPQRNSFTQISTQIGPSSTLRGAFFPSRLSVTCGEENEVTCSFKALKPTQPPPGKLAVTRGVFQILIQTVQVHSSVASRSFLIHLQPGLAKA